ncbi:hypothetical protein PHMEG_00033051, partial [Phytophthora megakarya]
ETNVVRKDSDDEESKEDNPGDCSELGGGRSEVDQREGEQESGNGVTEFDSAEGNGSRSGGASATTQEAMLAAVLQQLTTTMARMDARLTQLETSGAAEQPSVATETVTGTATSSPGQSHQVTVVSSAAPVRTSVPPRGTAIATQSHRGLGPRDTVGHDDDAGDDSDGSDSSPSSSSDDDSDDEVHQGQRLPAVPSPQTAQRRRRNFRDLEIAPFQPSPTVSVATWIAKADLALQGARISGRGDWTDTELYYHLGNKLQDNAARWWVQMDQELREEDRTWTKLKKALTRRYGERPDKDMAEWRVSQRRMLPGETYADFAAGLREMTGQNHVSERVLLAQFYRSLDKTTRQLVRFPPKPRTLEDAVDKATEINDPKDNVARGMQNIGQAWATAPNPYMVPMDGTTGQMMVIPGIGATRTRDLVGATTAEEIDMAHFSNPQGAYNPYTGTWDIPEGRVWNGRYWAVRGKQKRARSTDEVARRGAQRADKKARVHLVKAVNCDDVDEESDSDDDTAAGVAPSQPPQKLRKASLGPIHHQGSRVLDAAKLVTSGRRVLLDLSATHVGHAVISHASARIKRPKPERPKCYACGSRGHFARECTDQEAKARNDAYLRQRGQESEATQGNDKRTQ